MTSATRRVLLVDDERTVRQVAQRMLERRGYEVTAVPGGREALEAFRRRAGSFGVVLLDWSMPGMDGGETCQQLQRIRPGVPVVFMSGARGPEMMEQARAGGSRILRKPFSGESLAKTLAAVS